MSQRALGKECGSRDLIWQTLWRTRRKEKAAGPTCLVAVGSVYSATVTRCMIESAKQRKVVERSGCQHGVSTVEIVGPDSISIYHRKAHWAIVHLQE
jgi:hypothetical protein